MLVGIGSAQREQTQSEPIVWSKRWFSIFMNLRDLTVPAVNPVVCMAVCSRCNHKDKAARYTTKLAFLFVIHCTGNGVASVP